MGSKVIFSVVCGIVFVMLSATAAAQGGIPHQFYGTVTTNGNPAPDNLFVTAKMDNGIEWVTVAATITHNGGYGYTPDIFYILDPDGNRQDDPIQFFVADVFAGEWTFSNGNSTQLDLSVTGDFCGDGICTGSESCSSCSQDCGTCPGGSSPGGSSPGGSSPGGSSPEPPDGGGNETPPSCIPNWVCSEWLDCFNGIEKRVCVDSNECGGESSEPITQRACEVIAPGNESMFPDFDQETPGDGITGFLIANGAWVAGAVIIIVLAILAVFGATRRTKKKHKK
jgi:hypothetical protein